MNRNRYPITTPSHPIPITPFYHAQPSSLAEAVPLLAPPSSSAVLCIPTLPASAAGSQPPHSPSHTHLIGFCEARGFLSQPQILDLDFERSRIRNSQPLIFQSTTYIQTRLPPGLPHHSSQTFLRHGSRLVIEIIRTRDCYLIIVEL
ncbi:hypothetical protein Csa_003229 [Cucumis sativus]|uniref:Uncharacterized protein n=1 Tax=Cucumis sativus TaxID=3659 RepID=A0A0A0KKB0_CUCSA|nr:hypothetical protein Csa_003229 [Cucumis sativus]